MIVKILKENKIVLINFFNKLEQLIKEEEYNEEKYKNLCAEISLKKNIINFSQKKRF